MRWTRAAWAAGCVAPFMGGCLPVYHPHHDHAAEARVAMGEREIARDINRKAVSAWQIVKCEFPRKVFTAEFRDGFIAGYSDYLDRGGDGTPPAVPPLRYTQNKRYFTPEGHALMRDFLLGFQYGTEVAVATGQRQYLTVPVLIPDDGSTPANIADPLPSGGSSDAPVKPIPPPQPLPQPKPIGRLPMPRPLGKQPAPAAVTTPYSEPEVTKFDRFPLVPVPGSKPLLPPLPEPLNVPTIPLVPKASLEPKSAVVPASGSVKLPTPPREVLDLPDDVPTPPVIFDLPDLPPVKFQPEVKK